MRRAPQQIPSGFRTPRREDGRMETAGRWRRAERRGQRQSTGSGRRSGCGDRSTLEVPEVDRVRQGLGRWPPSGVEHGKKQAFGCCVGAAGRGSGEKQQEDGVEPRSTWMQVDLKTAQDV